MTNDKITYYALLAAGRTRENPSGLVRSVHSDPPVDEALRRDMTWQPTEYLRLHLLGHDDIDHVEITEQEAVQVLERWRSTWAARDDS